MRRFIQLTKKPKDAPSDTQNKMMFLRSGVYLLQMTLDDAGDKDPMTGSRCGLR